MKEFWFVSECIFFKVTSKANSYVKSYKSNLSWAVRVFFRNNNKDINLQLRKPHAPTKLVLELKFSFIG